MPQPKRSQTAYLARAVGVQARFARRAEQAWSPPMWRLIAHMRREYRYDAAHLFGGVQVYEYAPALRGVPTVITPYESYALYLRRFLRNLHDASTPLRRGVYSASGYVRYRIARAFERFMFTPYAHTVVVSDVDRAELLGINPALDVRVIANGVDPALIASPSAPRDPNTLIFTGNYDYAPNVDAALWLMREIFPRVQAVIPDARLWIVGNAPPPEIAALASESISVTGRVPEIAPYLARASVYVSPLRWGAGIKNKILEALAVGVPTVATPISVDGIAVQPDEHVVIAHSSDAISAAVIRVLGDDGLRARLSANGQRLIQSRYTWGGAAQAYLDLYQSATPPKR